MPVYATRDHSWEKIRRVFRYVWQTLDKKYDWYLRADDDSYVVVDNARKLVAEHDPAKPSVLGYRWGHFEVRAIFYFCVEKIVNIVLLRSSEFLAAWICR